MKRFVCVLLAVLLMLSLLPTAAFATEETEPVFEITASGSTFVNDGGSYKTTLSQVAVYDDYGDKANLGCSPPAKRDGSPIPCARRYEAP